MYATATNLCRSAFVSISTELWYNAADAFLFIDYEACLLNIHSRDVIDVHVMNSG